MRIPIRGSIRGPIRGLGAFALLGIATLAAAGRATAQAVQPAPPKPAAPAPARAQEKDKDAEAKRQREQAQQQAKEKERAEKAGEHAKAPAPANAGTVSVQQQRDIAKKAAHYAKKSRDQQARVDRLIRIYKSKGDTEKVAKLEAMRAQLVKRTDNAMEGFRKRLGDEKWGQLNSEMKKHQGRDANAKAKRPRTDSEAKPQGRPSGG